VHERAPRRLVGGMQEFGGGGVWGNGVDILERVDAIYSPSVLVSQGLTIL